MINLLKNIFSISYLKNKGIRRLCFILGFLLSIFLCFSFFNNYDSFRIKDEYENLYSLKRWYLTYYEFEPQKALNLSKCMHEHFDRLGLEPHSIILDKDLPLCLGEDCKKINAIADFKIKLDCGKITVFLKWPFFLLFAFYLPFLFCVLFKFLFQAIMWVLKGFKDSH